MFIFLQYIRFIIGLKVMVKMNFQLLNVNRDKFSNDPFKKISTVKVKKRTNMVDNKDVGYN